MVRRHASYYVALHILSFQLLNLYLGFRLYKLDLLYLVYEFFPFLRFSLRQLSKENWLVFFTPFCHFATFLNFISNLEYFLRLFAAISSRLPSTKSEQFSMYRDKMSSGFDSSFSDDSPKVIVEKSPLKNQARDPLKGSSESSSTSGTSVSFNNSRDEETSAEYLSESHRKEDSSIFKPQIKSYRACKSL